MTMDEIIDYAISSPENTNPNVLKSMLQQMNSGNGGSSNSNIEVIEFQESIEQQEDGSAHITLNMTCQEIYNAFQRGAILYNSNERGKVFVEQVYYNEYGYEIFVSGTPFEALNSTDYPSYFQDGIK